jgi:Predicted nucleotide kinase (related to CMP and AMP kinases)
VADLLVNTPFVKYIPELDTYEIVDLEQSRILVYKDTPPGSVVDTHVVELSPDPEVVIVLRKAPDLLYRELERRGWPLRKILDNVWAEMLDGVYVKALERWGEAIQIDVSRRSPDETFEILKHCVKEKRCRSDEVDWLSYAEKTGFLEFIERLSR